LWLHAGSCFGYSLLGLVFLGCAAVLCLKGWIGPGRGLQFTVVVCFSARAASVLK
jgi:hypothetical protein